MGGGHGPAVNFNRGNAGRPMTTSHALLANFARWPATQGLMLTFDDFLIRMEQFATAAPALMQRRRAKAGGAVGGVTGYSSTIPAVSSHAQHPSGPFAIEADGGRVGARRCRSM